MQKSTVLQNTGKKAIELWARPGGSRVPREREERPLGTPFTSVVGALTDSTEQLDAECGEDEEQKKEEQSKVADFR